MEEMEENNGGGGAIGDWRTIISSPRAVLWSGCGGSEGFAMKSLSQILNNGSDSALQSGEKVEDSSAAKKGGENGGFSGGVDGFSSDWKPPAGRNGGSIAERRAARCGFSAPRINTARFRSISPLSSPSVRSPYLTIPPGLSPTALLDSPVMLPNSQAQPSPTTGSFPFPSLGLESAVPISALSNTDKDSGEDIDSSFVFKPLVDPIDVQRLTTENQAQNVDMPDVKHQAPPLVQKQMEFESQAGLLKDTMTKNYSPAGSPSVVEVSNNGIVKNTVALQTSHSTVGSDPVHQHEEQLPVEDLGSQHILEGERGAYASMGTGRPSEDGYNWRKYGQKQVKGSEYPRSYYKCTHPNCQVKKKIERSHDGQITKIIHKGAHCHPKPQPSRRSALGSGYSLGEMPETGEGSGPYAKGEGGSAWRSIPQGSKDNRNSSDWRADGLERTSSTSVVTDLSDPLSTGQGKHLGALDSADTPELSSTLASLDEDEDRATQGSVSIGDDADDDESESKRRKKDSCLIETSLASRSVREPRVVVQTDSEVDILDDGYRWRKYGQKVVKGNPNPRSYYKCTNPGCSVRKHVERASHDLKYVITTYEGKHNHEVPAARSSSHVNSTAGIVPPAASNAQTSLTLPRSNNIPKPEPQIQDLIPRFERKPEHVNEFFKPTNLGTFASDMKFGASACYDMKLPPFPPSMPCGSYGLNTNHGETHPSASISQVVSEFPISLPTNLPLSAANFALNSFDFNNSRGKGVVGPAAHFLGTHQLPKEAADMRFIRPKQEQKDDTVFESHLPVNHLTNASPSMYHQMMGGFPM